MLRREKRLIPAEAMIDMLLFIFKPELVGKERRIARDELNHSFVLLEGSMATPRLADRARDQILEILRGS